MKRILSLVLAMVLVLGCSLCFAAPDPDITIVNPTTASSVSSDNLLVSVKIAKAATVRVSVSEAMKPAVAEGAAATAITLADYDNNLKADEANKIAWTYRSAMEAEQVSYTASLSYYTKKIENVTPGVYIIKVETLGAEDSVLTTNTSYVEVVAKTEGQAAASAQQSGTMQFLKSLLTSIFGK